MTMVRVFSTGFKKSTGLVRNSELRTDEPTLTIIDAKSIKNTDTAQEKGYDAGKKVSGIKLHAIADTMDLSHALYVTTANVTDRKGALETIERNPNLFVSAKKIVVDGGYSGERFVKSVDKLCGAEVEVVKKTEKHKFVVLPQRWVVERSFGWLENYRRLWKNCERKLHTSHQMTTLAFIAACLKRF